MAWWNFPAGRPGLLVQSILAPNRDPAVLVFLTNSSVENQFEPVLFKRVQIGSDWFKSVQIRRAQINSVLFFLLTLT